MTALATELLRLKRSADIENVIGEIARYFLSLRHTLLAQVEVARPLSAAVRTKLKKTLQDATNAREVHLDVTQNTALLGGCRVRLPGAELDASVATQLRTITTL